MKTVFVFVYCKLAKLIFYANLFFCINISFSFIARRAADEVLRKSLSTVATIVADFGDNLSPKTATVAVFGDSVNRA